jgi:hypothetical protein
MFDGFYFGGTSRYQVAIYVMWLPFLMVFWYGVVPESVRLQSLLKGILYGVSLPVQAKSSVTNQREYLTIGEDGDFEISEGGAVDVLQAILAPVVDSAALSGFSTMAIIADGVQQDRSESSRQITVRGEARYNQIVVFLNNIRLQKVPIITNRILIKSDTESHREHYVEIDFVLQTEPGSGFP